MDEMYYVITTVEIITQDKRQLQKKITHLGYVCIVYAFQRVGIKKCLYIILQGNNVDNKQAMEERMQQMEDMRNSILSQVLDQSARARCN